MTVVDNDRAASSPAAPNAASTGPASAAPPDAGGTLPRDPVIRLEALFDTGSLELIAPGSGAGAIAGAGLIDGTGAVIAAAAVL